MNFENSSSLPESETELSLDSQPVMKRMADGSYEIALNGADYAAYVNYICRQFDPMAGLGKHNIGQFEEGGFLTPGVVFKLKLDKRGDRRFLVMKLDPIMKSDPDYVQKLDDVAEKAARKWSVYFNGSEKIVPFPSNEKIEQ